ncbi:uncharacterized protein [Porites lutea]|uniref:uncharacterized protein isoform X2 n=1 Tax=Porites lutea TaxID=51062 RepID=UPI003CC69A5F
MSKLTAFFLVWSCSFCYAVQVFAKDAHGKVMWKDAPTWRDRSVVPTPPAEAVKAYKKRVEIPHPFKYPKVVKHVHVGPENSYGKEREINRKKNIIQRIFFSMPVGAELPLYYTHKQANTHKKSTVASSEAADNEGSRYFSEETNGPFRSNTWGPQQPIGENEELSEIETRAIAKQNLLPGEGPVGYHGIGGQYLRPQTIRRNKILRNTAQLFKRPSRTPGFLNVNRRSKDTKNKKTRRELTSINKASPVDSSKPKNDYIAKNNHVKKSGLPKGETLDDIMKTNQPGKKTKKSI